MGVVIGTFLLLIHAIAFLQKDCSKRIQKFPRSRTWGTALLLIATAWTFLLVRKMDLGEFANLRTIALGSVAAASLLAWLFLEEFLAARSTGFLALLAADPILNSCILWLPNYRLPLVILAYICVLCGLVWASMPYLMRDQIAWLTASSWRWNIAVGAGIVAGGIILGCSFLGA